MKRQFKNIVVAVAVAAISAGSVSNVAACGGRGGSFGRSVGGFGYGYGGSTYRPASTYIQPRHTQPVYPTASYGQPVYQQQPVAAPVAPARSLAPVATPTARVTNAAPVARTQPVQTQAVQTQPVQTQAVQTQAVASQSPVRQAQVTQTQAATVKPAPAAPATNAESSALAALAAYASNAAQPAATTQQTASASVPQFTPAPKQNATPSNGFVGTWTATLPSKVLIQLNLTGDGNFSWTVNNNGKRTQFSGQYRVTEGRMTLVRSNDLQQMAGSYTRDQNGFTFKLDGANNGGLKFQKA